MKQNRILVIEDDVKIARFLELELKHEGYHVVTVQNGREGYALASEKQWDVLILDLMLPEMSGIEICRRLRQHNNTLPIIMLTAKDDVSDKVMGLDIGADDYMTKPFAIEELLARIRVTLRKNSEAPALSGQQEVINIKGVTLNITQHSVAYNGEQIVLTKMEFDLLAYLMTNKNIALSREKIIEKIWGYQYMGETNIVDVYIRYLRSKIDQIYGIELITTIRGVGYCINE